MATRMPVREPSRPIAVKMTRKQASRIVEMIASYDDSLDTVLADSYDDEEQRRALAMQRICSRLYNLFPLDIVARCARPEIKRERWD